jgi:hypothetical protein
MRESPIYLFMYVHYIITIRVLPIYDRQVFIHVMQLSYYKEVMVKASIMGACICEYIKWAGGSLRHGFPGLSLGPSGAKGRGFQDGAVLFQPRSGSRVLGQG